MEFRQVRDTGDSSLDITSSPDNNLLCDIFEIHDRRKCFVVKKEAKLCCVCHLSETFCQDRGGRSWQPTVVCPSSCNLSSAAGRETEDNCHL